VTVPDEPAPAPAFSVWKLLAVVAVCAVMCVLVALHTPHLNGSWYWWWPWRGSDVLPAARWYGPMLVAAIPIMAAWFVPSRTRWHVSARLALLMLSVVAMKLTSLAVVTTPASFDMLDAIVRSPTATSYYVDAAALAERQPHGWLAIYPEFLPLTNLHTQSKPPGAVAYFFAFIRALGYGRASAVAGGIGLAILASLSVPAVYALTRVLTPTSASQGIASTAATLMALCPGYVLIFPSFDAFYPVLSCAMIGLWFMACARDDWRIATLFGAVLFVTTFITYNVLVIGLPLAAMPFVSARAHWRGVVARVIRLSAVALATTALCYAVFWLLTAYDPIATFRSAWNNQQALLAAHREHRPYPWTILFDLLDFLLGAGWALLLPAVAAKKGISTFFGNCTYTLFLGLPVVVAVTGLLQSETARVWNFMLPLLVVPAAVEVATRPRWAGAVCCASMLAVLLVIGHNMVFMLP
jgi:hypothetical protein